MLYGSRIGAPYGAPVLGGGLYGSRIGGFGGPVVGGPVLGGGLYGSRIGGFGGFPAATYGGVHHLGGLQSGQLGGLQSAQFGGMQAGNQQVIGSQNAAQTVIGSQHGAQSQAAQVIGSQHGAQRTIGALPATGLTGLTGAQNFQYGGVQTIPVGGPVLGLGASYVGAGPYAGGLGLLGANSAVVHPALLASGKVNAIPQGMLASLPRITTEIAPVQMENTIVDVEEIPVGYQYINHGIRRIPDNTPEFNQIMTEIQSGSLPVGSSSFVGNGSIALGANPIGNGLFGANTLNNGLFGANTLNNGLFGARSVIGGYGAAPLIGNGLAGMTTSIAPGAGLYGSYAGRALPFGGAPVVGPAGLYGSYAGVRRF